MNTHRTLYVPIAIAMLAAWSTSNSAESADSEVRLPTEQPWSLSGHAGINDPQSRFGNVVNGGLSFGIDLEYRINQRFAVEMFLGHDSFDGESGVPDIDVLHIAVNSKVYFPLGSNESYVLAGFGSYDFDPGPSEPGFNVGVGFESQVNPSLAWGIALRYHDVDTSGGSTQFYTLQGVVRFTF